MWHSIEHLDLLRCFGYWHLEWNLNFLGIRCLPLFGDYESIVQERTMNAQYFGFKLMPYFLNFRNHFISFKKWVDKSLKTIKSSKKIFMNTSMYSWKALVIAIWYVGGSYFDPKKHYSPYKRPPISNEGSLVLVLWCYGNLMVSKKTI